jgi:hypothetical protein
MRPEDEENITYKRHRDKASEPQPKHEEEEVLGEGEAPS